MPTVTIEDEDIDSTREVAGELSFSYISTLIDNLNDAQWERVLDFISAWQQIAPGDLIGLQGGKEGVRLEDQESLDDIRKRMRLLLGLPELRDTSITGGVATTSVPTLWVY
jgi:hypothetical protein